MSTGSRLSRLYGEADRICFDYSTKIVLMSDCHRGTGNWGDNFLNNQNLFFAALNFYHDRQFTYVELGDGDELWENRKLQNIIQVHSNAFWLMSSLYRQGRFYMLYGNHDRKKQNRKYMLSQCDKYYCESMDCNQDLFPGMTAREGLVLQEKESGNTILLAHGHQGDLMNDTLWRFTRFLVRYVWRKLELAGFHDPTSTAKNYRRKKRTEKALSKWAVENHTMLIAGHTHRPTLPEPGQGMYVNDGSCVHPRCITAIEIENGSLTLVKWSVMTRPDRTMYVGREVLEGPHRIRDYFGKAVQQESGGLYNC